MKSQMSSFDIAAIVGDLQQCIGLRVDKVFLENHDDLFFRLTGPGTKHAITLKLGRGIWLQDNRTTEDSTPPTFAMLLRKHLSGKALESVAQHGFDRVVEFRFEGGFRLIAEMFGSGNIILVEGNKIIQPLTSRSWKARDLKAGRDYIFPPESVNPFSLPKEELAGIVRKSGKDLVRCLAVEVNLGGAHSEEACTALARSRSDKASELAEEEISELFDVIQSFREELKAQSPHIVLGDDGGMLDVLPFELSMHAGREKREFETFSLAAFEYFSNLPEAVEESLPGKSGNIARLERQLASQLEAVETLEAQASEFQEQGDAIYANYSVVESLLSAASKMLANGNWQAVEKEIMALDGVTFFDPDNGFVSARLPDGLEIKLDIRMNINENAASLYDRSKKARQKLEGAAEAIADTRAQLEKAESQAAEDDLKRQDRKKASKKFWFDKFRWFISSEGKLVVGGRDTRTNDLVVKKHLKDGDLYAHADMNGAPSVVVKEVNSGNEATLEEACGFAVAFSRAWKAKYASGNAYWVKPDQVSKTPQPGEFLPKGAFIIRGKRNYSKKLEMRLAIGTVRFQGTDKVMCGPVDAVKAHAEHYFVIEPGDEKVTKFANKLSELYNFPIEEIERVLPPGDIRVVQEV